MTTRRRRISIALGGLLAPVVVVAAANTAPPSPRVSVPDFTAGDSVPENATHDWNLGPTGARGWMHSDRLETTLARQVLITSVDPGSPGDGVLAAGDVLLGVAGARFSFDPRTELGRAIGDAEAAAGRLVLRRWRDGTEETVVLRLPVLGAYAATAPFDCAKSRRILDRGCAALAARMQANPDAGNPIESSYNALALLASGRDEYLPLVRTQVERWRTYTDPDRRQLHSWWYGPINLLLAEYVIATGDRRVMPDLERITMEIVRGQSPVGSWGHRFVQANGRLAGYGMMNAPGLPLAVSLVLAREAGVDDPELDAAIERAARLVRFYLGKGSVPYGDHHPWIDAHDDNGKNGIAAILFHLLDDREAATWFSRMSVASHGPERDEGHTGNFFNLLWAMPGVALSGPQATGAWMAEFGWSYDLARRWDGSFRHQGPPAPRPDSYAGWDSTGAYLLAFAQPGRRIRLAGAGRATVRRIDAATAAGLIQDGRGWSPRRGIEDYGSRSRSEVMAGLRSWSPVVRDRSAKELARREGDPVPELVAMLRSGDLHARLGACVALAQLGPRAEPALDPLRETLGAGDLWLRVKAAEAIARIGPAAMPVLPDLLRMIAAPDGADDPRGMEDRYLCFALFDRREGLVGRSLDGVERELLFAAVVAGLENEDGRARGAIGSVYRNLERHEIAALLPMIHRAVVEPAPSGIMFADEIRIAGLEVLAEQRIAEGLPLCIDLIDPGRWGMGNRIERCLRVLRSYGAAARSEIPRLRALQTNLRERRWDPARLERLDIDGLVVAIERAEAPASPLISLTGTEDRR